MSSKSDSEMSAAYSESPNSLKMHALTLFPFSHNHPQEERHTEAPLEDSQIPEVANAEAVPVEKEVKADANTSEETLKPEKVDAPKVTEVSDVDIESGDNEDEDEVDFIQLPKRPGDVARGRVTPSVAGAPAKPKPQSPKPQSPKPPKTK